LLLTPLASRAGEAGKGGTGWFSSLDLQGRVKANKNVTEWLSALQEAVRASTGRALSVDHSDEAQNLSWWDLAKAYFLTAAGMTAVFAVIPLVVDQRLPNRLSELLPGPIFAAVMMALFLVWRWWRAVSAAKAHGGNGRTGLQAALLAIVVAILLALAVVLLTVFPAFYIGQSHFPLGDSIEITSVTRSSGRMEVKGHYNLVSHDSAMLALYITSTNHTASTSQSLPDDAANQKQISKGRGDFELIRSRLVPGLPHVAMYADGKSFASLYFGNSAEAAEERKATWISETNLPASLAVAGATNVRNADVLRAQINQAELEAARLKKLNDVGMLENPADLEAAQGKVEVLKAELEGDEAGVAQAKLAVAQRALQRASQLSQAGIVPGSEVKAAQAEVQVREAELKAAQAAGTNAAPKMQIDRMER
jgi:hypothetical protein